MSESSSVPENPESFPHRRSEGQLSAVLPLRDIVVFPHMIVPLFVGREKSVRALEEVMTRGEADPSADARRTPARTIPRPMGFIAWARLPPSCSF